LDQRFPSRGDYQCNVAEACAVELGFEVLRMRTVLVQMVTPEGPRNLIGDNGYDSDKLDEELSRYGIELIASHRSNRKNRTQDLRRLRWYRRRWRVEAVCLVTKLPRSSCPI
jgi:hypothetical protein